MRFPLPFALAALSATLPAVAQTHFCIGGDLDHLTQAEVSACKAKMTHVRETVRRSGAPGGWHFVVVCDETGWSDLAALTGKHGGALRNVDYSTDSNLQWTFVRGSRMQGDSSDATATVVAAALKSLPSRGQEAQPVPMPNPQRTVQLPALQVADAREPGAMEDAAGQ